MSRLKELWAQRTPKYNTEYQPLFEKLANKGNGERSEERITDSGKIFSTQYEFYLYAFFLGLYSNERVELKEGSGNSNFGHSIENWGKKRQSDFPRKPFTSIQDFVFAALIVKSEIDFIELEKSTEKSAVDEAINQLLKLMAEITNGGLQLIQELLEEKPNYFVASKAAAMNLILSKVS